MSQTSQISQNNNVWRNVIVISAMVALLAFALSANGEQKTGGTFATVDFQKISADYKGRGTAEEEIRKEGQKIETRLARRDNMPFISEEDHKALDIIFEKAAPTDVEKKKIEELTNKNKTRADEIQTIRQKPEKDLTADDKTKMAAADKDFRDATERFSKLKENWTGEFNQLKNNRGEDLMKKIRASIAKVAEQKGVAIVFNSEVALYAGTDLTDPVVAELNKK
jgi:Skp family chaperone for outer membrane proteins